VQEALAAHKEAKELVRVMVPQRDDRIGTVTGEVVVTATDQRVAKRKGGSEDAQAATRYVRDTDRVFCDLLLAKQDRFTVRSGDDSDQDEAYFELYEELLKFLTTPDIHKIDRSMLFERFSTFWQQFKHLVRNRPRYLAEVVSGAEQLVAFFGIKNTVEEG
jgi:hypothetical protein